MEGLSVKKSWQKNATKKEETHETSESAVKRGSEVSVISGDKQSLEERKETIYIK
jgi:hypothetical protein